MTDEELVVRWQKSKDRQALDDLRRRLKPLTQSQVNKYRSNSVAQSVLEAKADQILVESAGKFRPTAGASFRTYVFTNLRRLNRFSIARANIATIPEARAQGIGTFQRVYDNMNEDKQRPPTTVELADELMWSENQVKTMQRSLRMDIVSSGMAGPHNQVMEQARYGRLIDDIWYELTPDEKKVFGHLVGRPGFSKLSKGQDVSRATGFSQAKVSQIRKKIGKKMERHL